MKVLYSESGGISTKEPLEEKLVDKVFKALEGVKEFKNLSMDRQGEISVAVEKMIKE